MPETTIQLGELVALSRRATQGAVQPISELMHRGLAQPELISLAAGFVDQKTLPVEEFRQAAEAILTDPAVGRSALQYGTTPGYAPLRELILGRLFAADGITDHQDCRIDRVVVTGGSNQLLHLVTECLCDEGDIVIVAAPTYFVYLGLLGNMGVRAIGVEADQEGMIPAALETALQKLQRSGELPRVKLIYLVTYFDNPSSVTLAVSRRAEILELARRFSLGGAAGHQIHILEDAAYRDLRYDGEDAPSLWSHDAQDIVIYAGTFSKCLSPGLRIGYGVLPRHLVEPVCRIKGNIDFGTAQFNQMLLAKLLELGLLEPHISRIRVRYQAKLVATLAALEEHFAGDPGIHWRRPTGGLYVWLTLPEQVAAGLESPLFAQAIEQQMLYVPGEFCYAREGVPARANTIRLCFGVADEAQIRRGVASLAAAARQLAPT